MCHLWSRLWEEPAESNQDSQSPRYHCPSSWQKPTKHPSRTFHILPFARSKINPSYKIMETHFLGDHNIRVSLSKTSALNTVSRPCYEGNDFGHQEYLRLVQLVKEGFTSLRDHYPVLRLLLFIGEVWLFVTLHTQEIQGWCRTL